MKRLREARLKRVLLQRGRDLDRRRGMHEGQEIVLFLFLRQRVDRGNDVVVFADLMLLEREENFVGRRVAQVKRRERVRATQEIVRSVDLSRRERVLSEVGVRRIQQEVSGERNFCDSKIDRRRPEVNALPGIDNGFRCRQENALRGNVGEVERVARHVAAAQRVRVVTIDVRPTVGLRSDGQEISAIEIEVPGERCTL